MYHAEYGTFVKPKLRSSFERDFISLACTFIALQKKSHSLLDDPRRWRLELNIRLLALLETSAWSFIRYICAYALITKISLARSIFFIMAPQLNLDTFCFCDQDMAIIIVLD